MRIVAQQFLLDFFFRVRNLSVEDLQMVVVKPDRLQMVVCEKCESLSGQGIRAAIKIARFHNREANKYINLFFIICARHMNGIHMELDRCR